MLFDSVFVLANCVPFSAPFNADSTINGKKNDIWSTVKVPTNIPGIKTMNDVKQQMIKLRLSSLAALCPAGGWTVVASFGGAARAWVNTNLAQLASHTSKVHTDCCHLSIFTQAAAKRLPSSSDFANLTALVQALGGSAEAVEAVRAEQGPLWEFLLQRKKEGNQLGGEQALHAWMRVHLLGTS